MKPTSSFLELRQEAHVVLVEKLDVGDAVLEHRNAIEAHSEREAGVLLRIVSDVLEHDRMNHAAAEDLHPSSPFADAALCGADPVAFPCAAEDAAHVDFSARLDERKVARSEAQCDVLVEEAAENAWLGLRCFKLRQMVPPRVLSDEEWRSFEVPVLFLVGENEVIYSITGEEAVARLNLVAPEIETDLFSGCGHDLTVVEADRFNRRVLEFASSVA